MPSRRQAKAMRLVLGLPAVFLAAVAALSFAGATVATQPESCTPGLTATPNADGSILLQWPAVANATAYQLVVRAQGGEWNPVTPQATAGSTALTYSATVGGTTYDFALVALQGGSNPIASFCPVQATALSQTQVPFLAGPAMALAVLGAVGAVGVILMRRS